MAIRPQPAWRDRPLIYSTSDERTTTYGRATRSARGVPRLSARDGELIQLLGVSPGNPLDSLTAGITNTELITATRQVFVSLMLQYAGYFLRIIPINWWHRRRGPLIHFDARIPPVFRVVF